jgi:hypothetical protein
VSTQRPTHAVRTHVAGLPRPAPISVLRSAPTSMKSLRHRPVSEPGHVAGRSAELRIGLTRYRRSPSGDNSKSRSLSAANTQGLV